MGRKARRRPQRLAEKLLNIRMTLDLSQSELLSRLGVEDLISYHRISEYERGTNEPLIEILLQYARLAGVHTEALIDDNLDLPEKLPGPVKYGEIERLYVSRRKSKKR